LVEEEEAVHKWAVQEVELGEEEVGRKVVCIQRQWVLADRRWASQESWEPADRMKAALDLPEQERCIRRQWIPADRRWAALVGLA
jgi:hypothetical protein